MKAKDFCELLKSQGIKFYAGVPCSILAPIIDYLSNDKEVTYIPAVNEQVAVGIASGAVLAGKKACVLMQNSGLANCLDSLASLNMLYKIPLLLVVSWRGYGKDEPQHELIGLIMPKLLDASGIWRYPIRDTTRLEILQDMGEEPIALLLRKGIVE